MACLLSAPQGRLRVCSHSVIFEPDDEAVPLLKLKFSSVSQLQEHKEHSEWDGTTELSEHGDGGDVPEPVPEEEPALNAEDAFKAALNKKIMLGGPGPRPPRGSKPDEAAEGGGGGEKKKAPAHTAEQDALADAAFLKVEALLLHSHAKLFDLFQALGYEVVLRDLATGQVLR